MGWLGDGTYSALTVVILFSMCVPPGIPFENDLSSLAITEKLGNEVIWVGKG